MAPMTTASHPLTIADLWREARAWLAGALRDFRGPAAIARTFARRARAAIRARLMLIEALVMKLLLIEAAHLHQASRPFLDRRIAPSPGPINTPAQERGAAKAALGVHTTVSMAPGLRASRASGNEWSEDPARPSTWRVRFHLRIPREPTRMRTGVRPILHARPERIRARAHARALARRFEALRRVVADPRRAIAALARKLAALGAAARAAACRIAFARPRSRKPLGPIFAAATVSSHDSSFRFPDDTS